MPIPGLQLKAGGNIYPSRFVRLSTTSDKTILQAGANDHKILGVSQESTDYAPLNDQSVSAYAAVSGEMCRVYHDGEVCLLCCGGSVTAGDFLKSDANGKAVVQAVVGTTLQHCGAIALESGSTNELILALVSRAEIMPA